MMPTPTEHSHGVSVSRRLDDQPLLRAHTWVLGYVSLRKAVFRHSGDGKGALVTQNKRTNFPLF
jgi:hypothetical protein